MSKLLSAKQGEIVLYNVNNSDIRVGVIFSNETYWMTEKVIAELLKQLYQILICIGPIS